MFECVKDNIFRTDACNERQSEWATLLCPWYKKLSHKSYKIEYIKNQPSNINKTHRPIASSLSSVICNVNILTFKRKFQLSLDNWLIVSSYKNRERSSYEIPTKKISEMKIAQLHTFTKAKFDDFELSKKYNKWREKTTEFEYEQTVWRLIKWWAYSQRMYTFVFIWNFIFCVIYDEPY